MTLKKQKGWWAYFSRFLMKLLIPSFNLKHIFFTGRLSHHSSACLRSSLSTFSLKRNNMLLLLFASSNVDSFLKSKVWAFAWKIHDSENMELLGKHQMSSDKSQNPIIFLIIFLLDLLIHRLHRLRGVTVRLVQCWHITKSMISLICLIQTADVSVVAERFWHRWKPLT